MMEVRAVVRDGAAYWAASSGGLFRWTPATEDYLRLTNAEGLRTIDLTAVNVDADGNVWTGSTNGTIHVYTPSTGSVRTVLDIATANQTNKRINAIAVTGDSILFSTEFGLSLFRISRFEFGDTYSRFGTIPAGTRTSVTSSVIHDGQIWACISDGQTVNRVAMASLANPNLLPPEAWTLHAVGGAASVPRTLGIFAGRLYAGTSTGLFYYTSNTWSEVAGLSGKNVIALTPSASALLAVASDRTVYSITSGNVVTQTGTTLTAAPSAITAAGDGKPVVGNDDPRAADIDTSLDIAYAERSELQSVPEHRGGP